MQRLFSIRNLFFVSFITIVLIAIYSVYIFDWTEPKVTLTPDVYILSKTLIMTITIKDPESGVKIVYVEAKRKEANPIKLIEKTFTPPQKTVTEYFTLADLPWENGKFTLCILIRNASWINFLHSNTTKIQREVTLDTNLPILSVTSITRNIKQGGAAAITFITNEELATAGIRIGDIIFPAFKQEKGDYFCLFTFPWNISAQKFQPMLFGCDLAGNECNIRLNVHAFPVNFQHDTINLNDTFLNRKIPEFEKYVPDNMSNLDKYLIVNRSLRETTAKKIYDINRKTDSKPIWIGSFKRFKGKIMANFADIRTYRYKGKNVDIQTHLGIDIASLKNTEVQAANYGNVIFADNLGIYGLTLIIDHGLGLQTLYAHLSKIVVNSGDKVLKGQIIGRTGTTGLADGDHLHFQMMISGIATTPIEWCDTQWIKNNLANFNMQQNETNN